MREKIRTRDCDVCGICMKRINLFQRAFPLYGDTLKQIRFLKKELNLDEENYHRKCIVKEMRKLGFAERNILKFRKLETMEIKYK